MKFKYAQVTFFDKAIVCGIIGFLPIYIGVIATLAAFSRLLTPEKHHRTLFFFTLRYLTGSMTYNQFQWLAGTDETAYDKFIKSSSGLPHCIDWVGEETAKLMWVGTKTLDKVILYLHGGGYLFPLGDTHLAYISSLRRELASRGTQVGVAVLSYTLVPEGMFPKQLQETKDAIDFLINSGVRAENIILIGDSAGGNLILQVLAHAMHPRPSVPPFAHGIRFGGACLISPWVDLEGHSYPQTFKDNSPWDVISSKTYRYMGELAMAGVAPSDIPYMDPLEAPEDWFVGLKGVVARILVTAGEYECILEGQRVFYERLRADGHDDALFALHRGGMHTEVMKYDSKTGKYPAFNENVVAWLMETFSK